MGRLIPGPYSTNKNLTGTCAENLTDTFSYSSRAGSADNGPYVDVFRQLYNPKLNPRYNGKQFSSGTLHRAAGGVALRNTGAGLAGTCTQDNLRGPFIRGCESAASRSTSTSTSSSAHTGPVAQRKHHAPTHILQPLARPQVRGRWVLREWPAKPAVRHTPRLSHSSLDRRPAVPRPAARSSDGVEFCVALTSRRLGLDLYVSFVGVATRSPTQWRPSAIVRSLARS
jgi:hypothetical protein